jgi:uncharacterized protein (TIRG00374 family)
VFLPAVGLRSDSAMLVRPTFVTRYRNHYEKTETTERANRSLTRWIISFDVPLPVANGRTLTGTMTTGTQSSTTPLLTVRRGVWLVGTLLVAVLFVRGIGVRRFQSAILAADVEIVAVVVGVALLVLLFRGLALGVLLGILGYSVSTRRIVGVYAVTTMVSTVVPGGRAGGAPVNGHVVARAADADYEDGVVAVVVASLLSNLAIGAFGLCGVVYLFVTSPGGTVTQVAAVAIGLFGLVVLGVAGLWRVRGRVYAGIVAGAVRVTRVAGRLPYVPSPGREAVERRASALADAVARLREGSHRQVAVVGTLFAVAHGLTVVALWLSFFAVDQAVPPGVLLAVIPVAVVTAVVPTPGGFGGVDVALVGLLTAGTAAIAPVAGAAVLVYRTATSGPALLVGGPVVLAMGVFGWFTASADDGE